MINKTQFLDFFESSTGKRLLNFGLLIFSILVILHFSWLWRILIDKVSGLSSSINDSHIIETKSKVITTIDEKTRKTDEYIKHLTEFDNKMKWVLKYYLLEQDDICYKEIQDYTAITDETNRGFNINYLPFVEGSTDLKKIIVCNIYNSTIRDIYIEVPYDSTSKEISKIILDFIELYSKKWYKIHLIYRIDKITDLEEHRNVMKFISWAQLASITMTYGVGTNEDLEKVYKLLLWLQEFYEKNYGSWPVTTQFNFWVDFKYKNVINYQDIKIKWEKKWYKLEGYKKESSVESEIINAKNKSYLWVDTVVSVKDDFFDSFWKKDVDLTDKLFKYLDSQRTLFDENHVKWKLIFNLNFNKEYVDSIDWPTIYQLQNYKYIQLVTPNSQALSSPTTYETQVWRIEKQYEKILDERDKLLLEYKYKNLYLESKTKK